MLGLVFFAADATLAKLKKKGDIDHPPESLNKLKKKGGDHPPDFKVKNH